MYRFDCLQLYGWYRHRIGWLEMKNTPTQDKPIRRFRVKVVTVPPKFMIALGLAKVETHWRVIEGKTLAEAKRNAKIQ